MSLTGARSGGATGVGTVSRPAAVPMNKEEGAYCLPGARSGRRILAGQILGEGADAAQQIRRLGGGRR